MRILAVHVASPVINPALAKADQHGGADWLFAGPKLTIEAGPVGLTVKGEYGCTLVPWGNVLCADVMPDEGEKRGKRG